MAPRRFVFHHIQKTGGVSVERSAKRVMKVARARDWAESPRDWMARNPADWYSSHFLFRDYEPNEDEVYLTWVRDPVSMFYSAFWFWRRVEAKSYEFPSRDMTNFVNGPLKQHNEVRTYVDDVLANRYEHAFPRGLFDLPWERFDFIGVTERMEDSIAEFNRRYGTQLEPKHQNYTKGGDRDYRIDEVRKFLGREVAMWQELVNGRP